MNWSFFKDFFKDNFNWLLEYKRFSYSDWTNGNQYLTISKDWQEEGFWKINLTFNAVVDVFSARFTVIVDKVLKDYFEKDGSCYWLNYSIPLTDEVYSCFFNWSDLLSIPGLEFSKGVAGSKYWFSFKKDNVPQGIWVFDPSFGYSGISSSTRYLFYSTGNIYYMRGNYYTVPYTCYIDNFKVYTGGLSLTDGWIQGSIYEYIDYTTNFAGDLIATSDCTFVNKDLTYYDLVFNDTKPILNSGTNYYFCIKLASSVATTFNMYGGTSSICIIEKWGNNIIEWNNTCINEYASSSCPYIIVNYTNVTGGWSNSPPTANCFNPSNGSTGQDLNTQISTCINDSDGNSTTCDFYSNQSGTWQHYQTNNSVTANTTIYWNENIFNTGSTKYWWNVTVNDGNINRTFTQYYTTRANDSWQQPLRFNFSFSNQSFTWKQPIRFNMSFSNSTFIWKKPLMFNFSFSNQTFIWKQPFRFNMSFSNSTFIWRQPITFNFSFSNISITAYQNILWFNMSFSNTSISNYKNTLNFNMSFSNTSTRSYQNAFNFNFSFSNQSFIWKQPINFNFSFGNTTSFKQPLGFNMSFGNGTFIWKKPLMFNFSFSNTAVYKGGLWFNMSFSNTSLNATMSFNFSFSNSSMDIIIISNVYPGNNSNNIPLQPTIYATINNTYGNKMNISWYYGDSLTNCNNLLGQDLNITNSTQYELHFNASARSTIYYYRIMANDGTNWVNESFTFRTEGYPGGGISPNYGTPLGIAAAALVLSVFGIIALFRRKKKG